LVWTLHHYNDPSPIILSPSEHEEVSISQVAQLVAAAMNFPAHRIVYDTSKADGQHKKTASNAKLLRLNPTFKFTPITEAIQRSARWFDANYDVARK